jgi:hypothetical protein
MHRPTLTTHDTRHLPVATLLDCRLLALIVVMVNHKRPQVPNDCPLEFKKLMKVRQPAKRPAMCMEDVLGHLDHELIDGGAGDGRRVS